MVGGIVVETLLVPVIVNNDPESEHFGKERPACVWINVRDRQHPTQECAIYVEMSDEARSVSPGDIVWWQGGYAYWTPQSKAFVERPLRRRGYSGVSRPTVTVTVESFAEGGATT